jgi:hypothetical protein
MAFCEVWVCAAVECLAGGRAGSWRAATPEFVR